MKRLDQAIVLGLRAAVARWKARERRKRLERCYDALWAEAEFDAWRDTRDW